MSTPEKSDIEILLPGREVTLGTGEVVKIKALTFGESMRLQARLRGLLSAVADAITPTSPDPFAVLDVASEHVDEWFVFLSAVTGLDAARLAALDAAAGTTIAIHAIEENISFFGSAAVLATVKAVRASRTSSPSSSATATPAPQI